jgi:YVTN family beta-propeller protein
MLLPALPLSARAVRIYVTNGAGDTVSVIDPMTNEVVQVIQGIEKPDSIDFSPDGRRVYITNGSEYVVDVVDQKSGKIIKKVPLSAEPNTLAVTKDGGRLFVAIREGTDTGGLDVIDTTSLQRVRHIAMKGPIHDVYLTQDGKYLVTGSVEGKILTVIDVQTEQPVWDIKFDRGVQTMALESAPDGSCSRIFVNLHDLRGFAVVDFATHKEVDRIQLPTSGLHGAPATSHGIGVAPDGKTLWVNGNLSESANAVFVYSLPDLKFVGQAPTGSRSRWIAFSPDSKKVYETNAADNTVSVIDAKTLKEVAQIPVGQLPYNLYALLMP